jgi:hypothetical protein
MTSLSTGDAAHPHESMRARLGHGRKPRIIILAAAGLLAIGAFLLWGPIGLGNGPLSAAVGISDGWSHSGGPVGFVIPLHNSGDAPAVIDGLDIIGGTRYPAPRVLGLEVLSAGKCEGGWPAHPAVRGFVLAGCGGTDAGPLIGHAFGGPTPRISFGFPAAAEVAAPRSGGCWVVTKIVVHYHVGIRHYSSSGPYQLAVCASSRQVESAMNAAESLPPDP